MDYASKAYVHLDELHDAVAKRVADMTGAEAAMITSGAASALTLGTAACITGTDRDKIHRLPADMTAMKTEVIIQKSHRYGYDHAIRNCGVKLVEVETADQLEYAINANTAMMMFFNAADPAGRIGAEEFIALGKKHSIPTFNDAAADVPPVEHLSKYTRMGFDLVTFSGGKGLRGPQSTGLLLGRKDLIAAARMNASPNSDSIGRGMKVNKEEMIGMMVALEMYMKRDHQAEWKEWEKRVKQIADSVGAIPTVRSETWIPEIANHVPHLKLYWDEATVRLTPNEAAQKLREGEPAIEVVPGQDKVLAIGVWMMQPGDAEIVAARLRQVLKAAVVQG
jgi:L-seryl-tRNA(Ser) seleniumtransferase